MGIVVENGGVLTTVPELWTRMPFTLRTFWLATR